MDAETWKQKGITRKRKGRKLAICDLVEELKKTSSKWMKTKGVPDFYWQNGYGGFEVRCDDEPLIAYIENQEEHHKKQPFRMSTGRF